jgi:hypothetical protein
MKKQKETKDLPDCCKPKKEYKGSNPLMGIAYGLIPHIGCIMFIIGAILGATILMQFFKPLLMNRYIFHYLILISIGFAALSSFLYLKKNKLLHKEGIKSKKGYLSIMFGSTVGINLILFIFIFPFLTNFTGASVDDTTGLDVLQIKVDIPCPGHAPLISSELQTISGVEGSEYSFPNKFEVYYDASQTSEQEILSLEVFNEYPATTLTGDTNQEVGPLVPSLGSSAGSCSGGCGGTGSCGGGCGSPSCNYNQ